MKLNKILNISITVVCIILAVLTIVNIYLTDTIRLCTRNVIKQNIKLIDLSKKILNYNICIEYELRDNEIIYNKYSEITDKEIAEKDKKNAVSESNILDKIIKMRKSVVKDDE